MTFFKNKNKKFETQEIPVKKSRLKGYFFIIALAWILVGVFAVYKYAQKPATGAIKPPSKDIQAAQNAADVPNSFTGEHVSFMYGNSYVEKSHEITKNDEAVIVETAYFSQPSGISKKIALTVRRFSSGNLGDVPDFKMRELKPEKYKKEPFSVGEVSGTAFVPADDSQFEKSFFIKYGDLLAIIVVNAPAMPDKTLNNEADGIVKSLEWVK